MERTSPTQDTIYNRIGRGYAARRREDPQLAARIMVALGPARSVVNVGAGAGSYEPADREVIAIEPSAVMNAQRPTGSGARVIQARAQELPLAHDSVDAAIAVLTLHHWHPDQERGVREMCRVARDRIVLVTVDAAVSGEMWLVRDYLPELAELDRAIFPPPATIGEWLGGAEITPIEITRETPDWTLASLWAHPERVLDPRARAATSGFSRMPPAVVDRVVRKLERDLASGAWDRRYGQLREMESCDVGMRLITAETLRQGHDETRPIHGVDVHRNPS